MKSLDKLKQVVSDWKWVSHAGLTARNIPFGQLEDGVKKFLRAFRMLRQRKIWKDNVRASIRFVGLKVSEDGKGWNLHFHIALDCKWMDVKTFTTAWTSICRKVGLDPGKRAHTWLKRWKGNTEDLLKEGLKGTRGDIKMLVKHFKGIDGDLRWGEVLKTFFRRKWFHLQGEAKMEPEPPVEPVFCPRCGERFRYAEWEKVGPFDPEEAERRKKTSVFWADYYEHYAGTASDCLPYGLRSLAG